MKAQLDLGINNVLHGDVFDAGQFFLLNLAMVQVCACPKEVMRAKKRT